MSQSLQGAGFSGLLATGVVWASLGARACFVSGEWEWEWETRSAARTCSISCTSRYSGCEWQGQSTAGLCTMYAAALPRRKRRQRQPGRVEEWPQGICARKRLRPRWVLPRRLKRNIHFLSPRLDEGGGRGLAYGIGGKHAESRLWRTEGISRAKALSPRRRRHLPEEHPWYCRFYQFRPDRSRDSRLS